MLFLRSQEPAIRRAFLLKEQGAEACAKRRGRVRAVKTVTALVQAVVPDPEPGSGGREHFIGECAGRTAIRPALIPFRRLLFSIPFGLSRAN